MIIKPIYCIIVELCVKLMLNISRKEESLMAEVKIPQATAKRLPIYYRYLRLLSNSGKNRVSSTELAEAVKVDSATIRRDFSYFGALGKRGYGYDVQSLLDFFTKQLNQDTLTNVALVGVGNLGHALLNFNFHQSNHVRISAAFDVNEDITGTIQSGIPVYPMSDMKEQLKLQQIVTDELVEVGVRGILNFTPLRITVPENIRVQNVDLTNEMETLIYFLNHFGSTEE